MKVLISVGSEYSPKTPGFRSQTAGSCALGSVQIIIRDYRVVFRGLLCFPLSFLGSFEFLSEPTQEILLETAVCLSEQTQEILLETVVFLSQQTQDILLGTAVDWRLLGVGNKSRRQDMFKCFSLPFSLSLSLSLSRRMMSSKVISVLLISALLVQCSLCSPRGIIASHVR